MTTAADAELEFYEDFFLSKDLEPYPVQEEAFNHITQTDVSSVDHPAQIQALLSLPYSAESKVPKMAECFSTEIVGSLDSEWVAEQMAKYDMLPSDLVFVLVDDLVKGVLAEAKPMFKSIGLKKSQAAGLVTINIMGGYYFRLSEEILGVVDRIA